MKVTALIPDELVQETKTLSNAKNITEALIIALNTYVALKKLEAMGESVRSRPVRLRYSAEEVRKLNRER
jgi:bifunctional ADP-heptose synthase (sugar kinase/adenylyltransferase)